MTVKLIGRKGREQLCIFIIILKIKNFQSIRQQIPKQQKVYRRNMESFFFFWQIIGRHGMCPVVKLTLHWRKLIFIYINCTNQLQSAFQLGCCFVSASSSQCFDCVWFESVQTFYMLSQPLLVHICFSPVVSASVRFPIPMTTLVLFSREVISPDKYVYY